MARHSKPVHFKGHSGDPLAGILDLPAEGTKPLAFAVYAHCFTCSKNVLASVRICKQLATHGIGVLRFDLTGLGSSKGDFSDTNFSTNVEDIVCAAKWLEEHYEAPKLLAGHSLGGAAVLVAAHKLESITAVSTIGAPAHADHVIENFGASEKEIDEKGQASVSLSGRDFILKKQFLDDLRRQDVLKAVEKLDRAYMIFHSPIDNTVGIENAGELYRAAKHPKSFVSMDYTEHLVTERNDAHHVADVLGAWVKRYV